MRDLIGGGKEAVTMAQPGKTSGRFAINGRISGSIDSPMRAVHGVTYRAS